MIDIKEKLEQGYIHSKVIIEILGKPKEYVESSIKKYVETIKQDKNIEILQEEFAPAEQQEDMWASFVELETLMVNIPTLIGFCFDYMPSSVEIIAPEELKLKNKEISNFLNDLQAKLHMLDMAVKQLRNENIFLKKNTNSILKNTIAILLFRTSRTAEQLSKATGIQQKELMQFLDALIKENKLKKQGEQYSLVK